VEPLHRLQLALLAAAIDSATPGGVVGYVTCSPHRRETVDVVAETLAGRDDVIVIPADGLLPGSVEGGTTGDFVQLWPHRHGTDAMFAAYLRRL
jgi:16S rRNA (cytosine967-C5)-methyltransferase